MLPMLQQTMGKLWETAFSHCEGLRNREHVPSPAELSLADPTVWRRRHLLQVCLLSASVPFSVKLEGCFIPSTD